MFGSVAAHRLRFVNKYHSEYHAANNEPGPSAEEAFDELTREIFIDYASSDSLTLNYTLKDPSAYGINLEEATWGEFP